MTDITIPITDREHTVSLACSWYRKGFRVFKMKVGNDQDEDVRRLEAVHRVCPNVAFVVDANQGYTRSQCETFVKAVKSIGASLDLLEQPVVATDLDSMAALRESTGIAVAADESVRSRDDAVKVIKQNAADCINIKIMKTAVVASLDIATYARANDVQLMIGGMVETRLAMGCSFSLVLGLGGFDFLDLDTPLLLTSDPIDGGYQYDGPRLLPWDEFGLGMKLQSSNQVTTIA